MGLPVVGHSTEVRYRGCRVLGYGAGAGHHTKRSVPSTRNATSSAAAMTRALVTEVDCDLSHLAYRYMCISVLCINVCIDMYIGMYVIMYTHSY